MTREFIDRHIDALVGPKLRDKWWNSPNLYWNGRTPLSVYESSEEGKKDVETYVMHYCYGK